MQQHKVVEEYLESVIPEKISSEIKKELREELKSHIYDRAEFYMEIGYDEETAIGKAVEQMGEAESVKSDFTALYSDSIIKAVLLFVGICAWNILPVSMELGYMNLIDPTLYTLPSVAMLGVFLTAFVCLVVYTIKCIRQKLSKQLMGIISAFILISLGSFVTSGIFFPIINAGKLVFRYITTFTWESNDLDIYLANIVSVILFTVFSFVAYEKGSFFRKKPRRLSLKKITAILSVVCICFLALYGFAFEKYEWWQNKEEYSVEPEENYVSSLTKEQREIYGKIELGSSVSKAEILLADKGFVKVDYKDFIKSHYFSHDEILSERINGDYAIYSYTFSVDEKYRDKVVCCIAFSYNEKNQVENKLFIPDVNHCYGLEYYLDYNHGQEIKEWYDGLEKGEKAEKALDFIRKTGAYITETEEYDAEKTKNTYKIYVSCFHPSESDFIDFLLDSYSARSYQYTFEIKAENGVIVSFEMTDCYVE